MFKYLKSSRIYILAFFIILNSNIHSQAELPTELLEALTDRTQLDGTSSLSNKSERMESFIQNEYSNVMKQYQVINKDIDKMLFLDKLRKERLKVASELCSIDPRACFLIEEYQKFKDSDLSKEQEELTLFGIDYFRGYPLSLDNYSNIPINDDYIITAGDYLNINIYGSASINKELQVDLSGNISIPQVGSFNIAGLSFSESRDLLVNSITSKLPGSEVSISLNALRALQLFVVGLVNAPGSYSLSPMSSIINPIISGGGFKGNASLRNIIISRGNEILKKVDLYQFLINGRVLNNFLFQNGDTILVEGTSNTFSITGEVNRPSIYEFIPGETISDALRFALGTTINADKNSITLKRLDINGRPISIQVEYSDLDSLELSRGDQIIINKVTGSGLNNLTIAGAVRSPGEYSIKGKMPLSTFIDPTIDLLEQSYTLFGVIKHFNSRTSSYNTQYFDLTSSQSLRNVYVFPGDQVFIFSDDDIEFINSISFKETLLAIINEEVRIFNVLGNTVNSSNLELLKNSRSAAVSDFVMMGSNEDNESIFNNSIPDISNLDLSCYKGFSFSKNQNEASSLISTKLNLSISTNSVECSPLLRQNPELVPILLFESIPVMGLIRNPGLYPVTDNIDGELILESSGGLISSNIYARSNFTISKNDLSVNSYPAEVLKDQKNISFFSANLSNKIQESGFVELVGAFYFPGKYPISNQTTLSDIYRLSGGLLPNAFPYGAVLSRESIRKNEKEFFKRSSKEISEVLTTAAATGGLKNNTTDLKSLYSLMLSVEQAQPLGRLIAEFDPLKINENKSLDIKLESGDVIYMPEIINTVSIRGQVLNPVTVPFNSKMTLRDYIRAAGGIKDSADDSRIFAIYANGQATDFRGSIFGLGGTRLLPGTTIYVPRKTRPLDTLALTEVLTPIIANLSVTAASIAAISD